MADQHLDSAWLTRWAYRVQQSVDLLTESFEETFGYPCGDNEVVLADDASRADARDLDGRLPFHGSLHVFYSVLASVYLPDVVDNGIFIHEPSLVVAHLREYGPVELGVDQQGVVFGSDGGGHLLAIDPSGRVHKSTTASWEDEFEVAAEDLREYLERVRFWVEEFGARRPSGFVPPVG